MSTISRRDFVAQAGILAASLLSAKARAIEPFHRSGRPQLRLSLAAYSFRDYFNHADPSRRITMTDFVNFAADQGCAGAEVTSYYFPKDLTNEYLLALKRVASLRGVALSGTAVGNNFARQDGPELTREIESVKLWIDRAAVMGAPHIRVFAGDPKGLEKAVAKRQCIAALEECGAYAAKKGVWLGLENHGGLVAQVDDLLEIIQAVQCPWVGVNLDSGNFYGPPNPYADMARLAPYAVNVQVKVEINQPGKGKAATDLARVVKILRDANYQGWVALEYEAAEDPWKAVPAWLKQMHEAFRAA